MKKNLCSILVFLTCSIPLLISESPDLVLSSIADFHGQLEPCYVEIEPETIEEQAGISRLTTAVEILRTQYPGKVALFGSGDYFVEDFKSGMYFSFFGGRATAHFLNHLSLEAAVIGNHELDLGPVASDQLLQYCQFPYVAANLQSSALVSSIAQTVLVEKNGYTIGVMGLMLPAKKAYATDLKMQFHDLYLSTQRTVNELKNKKVDCIIALSHLGFKADQQLAEAVDGIDLIFGGHDHKTLREPFIVNKADHTTRIVHTGDRGLHLGVMKLWFQQNTIEYEWQLIDIDNSIEQDCHVEEDLDRFRRALPQEEIIGTTTTFIDLTKNSIRTKENGFANFVCDRIREEMNADIVLLPGGSIRGRKIIPAGDLTASHLDQCFPLQENTLLRMRVSGKCIQKLLEIGAAASPKPSKNFLHVSGLRYHICNTEAAIPCRDKPSHVTVISVQDADGSHVPLEREKEYDIVVNTIMVYWLPEFSFLQDEIVYDTRIREKSVILDFFKKSSEISPKKDHRIIIE